MQHPNQPKITELEALWLKEKIDDLLCSIILNVKLRNAGICPKYFIEMKDGSGDYLQYCMIIDNLLLKKN